MSKTFALGVESEFLVYFQSLFLKGSHIKDFYKKTKNEKRSRTDILGTLNDNYAYLVPWRLDSNKITQVVDFVKKYAKNNPVYSTETSGVTKEAHDDLILLAGGLEIDWNETGRYGEIITRKPFNRSIGSVIAELKKKKKIIMTLIRQQTDDEMSNGKRAYVPEEGGANFVAYKNSDTRRTVTIKNLLGKLFKIEDSEDFISSDYNGSIHVNLTLPYSPNESKETVMVRNYSAMKILQWFEPMFVSTVGQPDPFSPVVGTGFTEGSFRMASNRWSGMGTQNLDVGCDNIPEILKRVANMEKRIPEKPFRGIIKSLAEDEMLKSAYPVPTPIIKDYTDEENFGPSEGSDFRRGDLDLKESDIEKKYFGFEFRILDHLNPDLLLEVLRVISLIGDHSETLYNEKYCVPNPLKNGSWNIMTKNIMNDGYNAIVTQSQQNDFYNSLKLKIVAKVGGIYASDMFQNIISYLYEEYGENGEWSEVFSRDVNGRKYGRKPMVENLNKKIFERYIDFFDIDPQTGNPRGVLEKLEKMILKRNLGKTTKEGAVLAGFKKVVNFTDNEARDYLEYLISKGILVRLDNSKIYFKKNFFPDETKK